MPARSSGVPQRFIGMRLSTQALRSTSCCKDSVSGVAMYPGLTALTVIWCGAHSTAITRVSWATPPLLAA